MQRIAASTSKTSTSPDQSHSTGQVIAAACHLDSDELNKKYLEGINAVSDPLSKADTVLTALGRTMLVLSLILDASNAIGSALPPLRLLTAFFDLIVLIVLFSLSAIAAFLRKEDSPAVKAFKFIIPVVLIGLFIAAFSLSLVEITISIFAVLFANKAWDLSRRLLNRFTGDWNKLQVETDALKKQIDACTDPAELKKLQQQYINNENKLITLRGEMAESIHSLVCGAISLTGAVLLIPPFTFIGVGILFSIGIYSLTDMLGINPLRWIANKIFNNPFKAVTREEVFGETPAPAPTPARVHTSTYEITQRTAPRTENVANTHDAEDEPLLVSTDAAAPIDGLADILPSLVANTNTTFTPTVTKPSAIQDEESANLKAAYIPARHINFSEQLQVH